MRIQMKIIFEDSKAIGEIIIEGEQVCKITVKQDAEALMHMQYLAKAMSLNDSELRYLT